MPARQITVRASIASESIEVAVTDGSADYPALVDDDDDRESGRGIRLVDMLADDWGVYPTDHGKTVWFALSATTWPFEAPPPTSRKFAGLPPKCLMMSIVLMARPAPLTRQAMLPSRLT